MRKSIYISIAIILVFGLLGVGHFMVRDGRQDTIVFEPEDEEVYPEDIRPEIPEPVEDEGEELVPDDDFVEFDVEDEEPEVPEYPIVTVTTKSNIRTEGNARAKILDTCEKGEIGYLIEEHDESWSIVEFHGVRGFTNSVLLLKQESNPDLFNKWHESYKVRFPEVQDGENPGEVTPVLPEE